MKTKQIWLEATHLFISKNTNKSGIGNYTENIIKNIIDIDQNKSHQYRVVANLFFTKKKQYIAGIKSSDFSYLYSRLIPGKVWNLLLKKKLMPPINLLYLRSPDLIVNFDFVAMPVTKKVKTITVIHDLAFMKYPQFVETKNLKRLKKFVPEAIKKSAHLVAVSESTKRDIIDQYDVRPDKISVVYNAVDRLVYRPQKMTNKIKVKYGLPDEYILYLGNIEPRKNIVGIISAYEKLPDDICNRYKLVLAGGKGWNDKEIIQKLKSSPKSSNIILTGYVDQIDAAFIYSSARVFLFPSYYEGFGLPILESMACGTPVITASNSSLEEVGGDAAIYVSANDSQAIAHKIILLLQNDKLYGNLVKKGIERAQRFNWEDSAKSLKNVIDEVLE